MHGLAPSFLYCSIPIDLNEITLVLVADVVSVHVEVVVASGSSLLLEFAVVAVGYEQSSCFADHFPEIYSAWHAIGAVDPAGQYEFAGHPKQLLLEAS